LPPTTVTITGKVLGPNGVAAAGGRIRVRLVDPGGTDNSGDQHVVAGESVFPIAADGSVSFPLIPSALISPTSSYEAVHEVGSARWVRSWIVPTTPSTQHIGDL